MIASVPKGQKPHKRLPDGRQFWRFGVWEWNLLTEECILSAEACAICGLYLPGATLALDEVRMYIHPEDRQEAENTIREAVKTGEAFETGCRIVCVDGHECFACIRGGAIFSPDGVCTKLLGTVQEAGARHGMHKETNGARFKEAMVKMTRQFPIALQTDTATAINRALRIAGEYCMVGSVAVYRFDEAAKAFKRMFIWHKNETASAGECEAIPFNDAHAIKNLGQGKAGYYKAGQEQIYVFPLIKDGRLNWAIGFSSLVSRHAREYFIRAFSNIMSGMLQRVDKENALLDAHELNHLLLNSTSDAIFMLDRECNILFANREMMRRHNQGRSLEGMHIKALIFSQENKKLMKKRNETVLEVFRTGQPITEEDQRDGFYFSNRYYPVVKDGNVTAVTIFSTDITDRVRADEEELRLVKLETEAEALRKKEEEFVQLLDGGIVNAWIYDFIAHRIKYSEAWKKHIGCENIPAEDMEKYLQSIVHPEDTLRVARERGEFIGAGRQRYTTEYRLRSANGEYFWILDQGKCLYSQEGKPEKMYGISIDITERKKSELVKLHRNNILQNINRIYKNAMRRTTLIDIAATCLEIARQATQSKSGFYGQGAEEGFILHIPAGETPLKSQLSQKKKFLSDRGTLAEEITGGRTFICNVPYTQYYREGEKEFRLELDSVLAVPYLFEGKTTGLIAVSGRPGGYFEEQKEIMEIITPVIHEVLLRKNAEEKLKESELLMRTVLDNAADFIFLKNRESRVVMINRAYGRIFGVDIKDVIGKNDLELYGDEGLAKQFMENDQKVMQTGRQHVYEESVMTPQGYRTYLMSKVPWRDADGVIMGILGTGHDITQRKEAELEVLKKTAELEQKNRLLDLSTEAIFATDMQFIIQYWNYGAQKLYGYSREEALGQDNHRLLKTELPPELNLLRTLETLGYWSGELMHTRKNGQEIILDCTKEVIVNNLGEKTILVTSRDITERKDMEQKLIRQAEELREADRNKDGFLSVLSHELRNPLAVISTGMKLLDIVEDTDVAANAKEIIKRQLTQLCRLVDDLLDLTRITQKKINLKKEPVCLNDLAAYAAEDMRLEYARKHVALFVELKDTPAVLFADPVRITQIIGNLLSNALRFTQPGGSVWLSLDTDNGEAVLGIRDNGEGIRADILQRLFEPFFQSESALKHHEGGLGLGLSIVKNMLTLHGGSISAKSEGEGKGALFTVRLPMMSMDAEMAD
jgi:PAS domain S-box-containing protein